MGIEEELIKEFREITDATNTQYFCTEFIVDSADSRFNPYKFVELCAREEKQKLGYLADLILTLEADNVLKQRTAGNLKILSKMLQKPYNEWVHISTNSEFCEYMMEREQKTPLNIKWKVYPVFEAEDILDWLDLYHPEYLAGIDVSSLLFKKKGFHRLRV